MNWIDRILQETSEAEAPESWFYWSALTTISTVIRRNIFMNRFYYKLYPNIYTILIGESGLRKGVPMKVAAELVEKVGNSKVISGKSTIEAAIQALALDYTTEGGNIISGASGLILTDELAAFITKSNADIFTDLTTLYDSNYHKNFNKKTKTSGSDKLKDLYVTLLAATNEVHLEDCIPSTAIGGGFIARSFCIVEEKAKCVNSLVYPPRVFFKAENHLEYLVAISQLQGEMKFTKEGGKYYDDWYRKHRSTIRPDQTGTSQRISDGILKVAILISLAKKLELTLDAKEIDEAINRCSKSIEGARRVVMGKGKSQFGAQTKIFLSELISSPNQSIHRHNFLRKYWGDVDSLELDRIVETMLEAKAITMKKTAKGIMYHMTEEAYQSYRKYKEEPE